MIVSANVSIINENGRKKREKQIFNDKMMKNKIEQQKKSNEDDHKNIWKSCHIHKHHIILYGPRKKSLVFDVYTRNSPSPPPPPSTTKTKRITRTQ